MTAASLWQAIDDLALAFLSAPSVSSARTSPDAQVSRASGVFSSSDVLGNRTRPGKVSATSESFVQVQNASPSFVCPASASSMAQQTMDAFADEQILFAE